MTQIQKGSRIFVATLPTDYEYRAGGRTPAEAWEALARRVRKALREHPDQFDSYGERFSDVERLLEYYGATIETVRIGVGDFDAEDRVGGEEISKYLRRQR